MERTFTQADYNEIVFALDKAMLSMTSLGKTEDEARSALRAFVLDHYFPVWRKIIGARTNGQSTLSTKEE